MRPPPAADESRYRAQRVRRLVSPYGVWDYAVVVKNNLRQKPSSRHRAHSGFLPSRFRLSEASVGLRVGFLGDLMPCGQSEVRLGGNVLEFFAGIDRLVVNFEGCLWSGSGPVPSVLAAQHHSDLRALEMLDALSLDRSRIVVSVANNHSADFGFDAFSHTVSEIERAGYVVVGAAWDASVELSSQVNLVAATQWTNQRHDYPASLDDVDRWRRDDRCNILFAHWGHELETHPRPALIDTARELIASWDAVVGHHSHGPAPVSAFGADDDPRLVAFSLGDAATAMKWPVYHNGLALRLDIGPDLSGRWRVAGGQWTFLKIRPGPPVVVLARETCSWFPTESADERSCQDNR